MNAKSSPPTIPQYVSQADIDALLQGAGTQEAPPEGPEEPQSATADADEVMISQTDIDALLQGAGTQEAPPEGLEESQPASAEADEVMISQADIDALLQAASAPVGPSDPSPGVDPRSSNAGGDGGEEIFISQADIDALMASEDLVASEAIDLASPGVSAAPDPQAPAADRAQQEPHPKDEQEAGGLPVPSAGRDGTGPQKVILAPSDGEQSPAVKAPEDQQRAAKRWFSSKTLWTVAAVLLILISTVTSFSIYGRRTSARGAGAGPQTFPIPQSTAGAQAPDPTGPVQMVLAGFVVPASFDKEGAAGLLVDVQLAFSDAAAGSEVKRHEPYFRSLVFGVLSDVLADRSRPEVDEPALTAGIKDALNRALPRASIRTVALENLRLL
jgi:flagellar basal body-associated protein FliL